MKLGRALSLLLLCGVFPGCQRSEPPRTAGSMGDPIDTTLAPFSPDGPQGGGTTGFCRTGSDTTTLQAVHVATRDWGRVNARNVFHAQSSSVAVPVRCVIRSEEQLRQFFSRVTGRPRTALETVDFGREMVVVATSGTRPNQSYDIRIEGVWLRGDSLAVSVRRQFLQDAVGELSVTPLDAVVVPRTTGPVFFVGS